MLFWVAPDDVARHLESNVDKREQICSDIDDNGFDWQIWAVASSGFFTDSYNLFATNVILPSLAFIYWSDDTKIDHETAINCITLAGSLVGQLVFGFLADKLGRKKLYGVELLVVIFGTIGFVQCSAGYDNASMNIFSWIMFWRFFVGLGIGAEYPLSALITVEFAPRRSRARMMAAVFLMQPLGQLLTSVVGLAVLLTVGRRAGLDTATDRDQAAKTIDVIWRYVTGFGAIPALVAIIFRLSIPESPRYTLDVDHDGARALRDTEQYLRISRRSTEHGVSMITNTSGNDVEHDAGETNNNGRPLRQPPKVATGHQVFADQAGTSHDDGSDDDDNDSMEILDVGGAGAGADDDDNESGSEIVRMPDPFSWPELKDFFFTQGNIKYLLGTSICWFLLDFAFYGLGINNPRVIAQIWSSKPTSDTDNAGAWSNPADGNLGIYETLKQDGIHSIITVSVGSLLGSVIIIKLINYLPRKAWLVWSFVGTAVMFAVAGGSYFKAANSDLHALTLVLYVLAQLLFNLGPNTLTFIIPAEIFPTRYRGTCHGISAASGKLGSVIVQAFLPQLNISNSDSFNLAYTLIGFSFAMALGALVAWAWLPEVQNARGSEEELDAGASVGGGRGRGRKRAGDRKKRSSRYEVPSKSLEELALGRAGVPDDDSQVGFRLRGRLLGEKVADAMVRRRRKKTG